MNAWNEFLQGDTDFSEMISGGHQGKSLGNLVESENPVDDRFETIDLDSTIHPFKSLPGTDENTLKPDVPHQYWNDIEFR